MKFGAVDITRFQALLKEYPKLRTFLDGKDITDCCIWANDETGGVEVFKLKNGRPYLNSDYDLDKEILTGNVEFREET